MISLRNCKINKKIVLSGILLLTFVIFRGYILGFVIEKVNYYRGYQGSVVVTGNLKKNFLYYNNGGGLMRWNCTIKDNATGIIYSGIMDDLSAGYSEEKNVKVSINYDGSKLPSIVEQ